MAALQVCCACEHAALSGSISGCEFTIPSKQSFDPRRHASIASIRWRRKHFIFTINSLKTDQFCHGQAVHITKSDKSICPFAAMRQYVQSCGSSSNTPLFTFKTGEPLTRHSCLIHLRNILVAAGYQPHAFNTHSFRIGVATSAAQAGIPTPQIKLLGRWRSSAYQCYIRTVKESLRSAASSLAKLASN